MNDAAARPAPDPDAIAAQSFTSVRKGGFDHDEVRRYLLSVAAEVRELQRAHGELEGQVEDLRRRASDPKELDEATVTALLGEETARVLSTSRQAAAEIRAKADEEVAALRTEAQDSAAALRLAAQEYDRDTRAGADAYAEEVRGGADAELAARRDALETEMASARSEADEYAATTRSAVDAETAELMATTRAEADRLRTEAEGVLAERTEAAETAAKVIRSEAEAHAHHTREEADRYAEVTRGSADQYRAEIQGAADVYRAEATTEADRLRSDAASAADAVRSVAETEAAAQREAAAHDVAALVADAKEEGRAMVGEARTYRERVIADLADRRRAARTQLEQVAAARDAVAVALSDVVARIEVSHRALLDTPIDPREAGDAGVDRRALAQPEPVVEAPAPTSVGVGELDPPAEGTEPEQAEPEGGPAESGDGAPGDDEAGVEETPAADDALDDGPTDEGEPAAGETEIADDEDGAAPIAQEGGDREAAVHDLFARIREERGDADEAPPLVARGGEGEVDLDVVAVPRTVGAVAVEGEADADEADAEPGETDEEAAAGEAVAADPDPDVALLERRDAATDELERLLARRLKRVLADEQNEVLDLLRRTRGTPTAEVVLPSEADHLARYASAALEDLTAAERSGASFYGEAPEAAADVSDTAEQFAAELVRQIRARLERAFDDGGDEQEIGDRIRSCYREWKTQRIADTARHYVVVAFTRGVGGAAVEGTTFRWLVDDGEVPSPDCEDNALAGGVAAGEEFPTGDRWPPAHPGCRCLLVPVG